MRILVVNDDGIHSPGIAALARVAVRFGEVRIVAPDVERSAIGHAISVARPLRCLPTSILDGVEAFRVDGTPADCVALGIHLWDVDVVLAGVNVGWNLGHGTWHSGTLAAAKQASLLGVRGVALSAPVSVDDPHLSDLAPWIDHVLELLLSDGSPRLVNVNLPRTPRGIRWTAQAVDQYERVIVPGTDPSGDEIYWSTAVPRDHHPDGTDLWAVEHDYVSITPLRLDLTDRSELAGRPDVREPES